jgi:hemolysin activation/secretion protein
MASVLRTLSAATAGRLWPALAALAVLLSASVAAAQSPAAPLPPSADPAAIGRGLADQQRRVAPERGEPVEPVVSDGAAAPAPESDAGLPPVTFELRRVRFDASAFLAPAELEAAAAPKIGRQVSLADLRAIAAAVNALYAARGIPTARAYVPPQKIVDGEARIALIEGRLGALRVSGGKYTGDGFARSRLRLVPGEVIDIVRLRRQIAEFNRNNDSRMQAQLQPGAEIGLTDILVSLTDPPRNEFQTFANSYGYESTGRAQAGLSFRRNGLLVSGDRSNLFLSGSDGGLTGSASYSLPIRNARLGVSYARSHISITQGPSADLDIDGVSDTASLNGALPALGGATWYVTALAGASYTASTNRISDAVIGKTHLYRGSIGWSLRADLGRSVTLGTTQMFSLVRARDSLEPGTTGFTAVNLDLSLEARLAPGLRLRVAGAGQYVGADFVPASQLFQIGGPLSVRGFQPGATSGPSGYFAQAELHYAIRSSKLDPGLFLFVDGGKTYSKDFGDRGIVAAGAGVRFRIGGFEAQATYGVPLTARRDGEKRGRLDASLIFTF